MRSQKSPLFFIDCLNVCTECHCEGEEIDFISWGERKSMGTFQRRLVTHHSSSSVTAYGPYKIVHSDFNLLQPHELFMFNLFALVK